MTVLRKRSLRQLGWINELEREAIRDNQIYNQAVINNHERRFRRSSHELESFVNDPQLRLSYFNGLATLACELERTDENSTVSRQVERNCFPELSFGALKRKIDLSGTELTVARRKIKAAGIDANQMNRRTIVNVIQQARSHHTSIYKYAKENY